MNQEQIPAAFRLLMEALKPWLDQIVIVGGWAHRLYRLHPEAQTLEYLPLSTLDLDVALPPTIIAGEHDIRAHLLDYGFNEEFSGEAQPPATHYHLGGDESGFYVEFLTPLTGSELDRKHKRRPTIEIAGASAQRLRYLELLLERAWSIHFETVEGQIKLQIANPVAFLAQKILIHRKRNPFDRAKDILYIRDTLEVFGARLPELANVWRNEFAGLLGLRQVKFVANAPRDLFGMMTDDIARAAQIVPERGVTPEGMRLACQLGLADIFGG